MDLNHEISLSIEKLENVIQRLKLHKEVEENYDRSMDDVVNNQDFDATFQKNLAVFKEYMPETYKEIISHTPTDFKLNISDDAHVNIVREKDGKLYYSGSPYSNALAQFVSFYRYPSSFSAIWTKNSSNIEDFCHSTYMDKLVDYFEISRENTREKSDDDPANEISTLVVLGIGLGLHLDMIATNMTLRSLFVYEPEFDVFYASLYVNDWEWIFQCLSEKNINFHLSLGISPKEFTIDFGRQMRLNLWHENVVTHLFDHCPGGYFDETLAFLRDSFHHYFMGYGFFDDALLGVAHQAENIKRNVNVLAKKNEHSPEFSDIPVFFVLNGPSLDSSIDIIRKYKDKALIVTGGTALSALHSYGIKPDIFMSMERTFATVELIQHSCPDEFLRDILLLSLNVIHPDTFELFDDAAVTFKTGESATDVFMGSMRANAGEDLTSEAMGTNPTVANLMASWLLKLGFEHFYMFGTDLAEGADNKHHSSQSIYYDEDGQDLNIYEVENGERVEVEANFGGPNVKTTPFFNTSRMVLEGLFSFYLNGKWFNTSHGAKINRTQPLPAEEIVLNDDIDKKAIKAAITSKFVPSNSIVTSDEFIDFLQLDSWKSFADHLVDFCDGAERVTTRNEAATFMRMHWDLVNLEGMPHHFYSTFCGTFHYQQSVIYSTLYSANNAMWKDLFVKCYKLFKESLSACRSRLDTHVLKCSDGRLNDLPEFENKLQPFDNAGSEDS